VAVRERHAEHAKWRDGDEKGGASGHVNLNET